MKFHHLFPLLFSVFRLADVTAAAPSLVKQDKQDISISPPPSAPKELPAVLCLDLAGASAETNQVI